MTQPLTAPAPVNLSLRGRIVGMPDIWGNTFSVSQTDVEIFTSDERYISFKSKASNLPKKWSLASTKTYGDAVFSINVYPFSPLIPYSTLFFEFSIPGAGLKYKTRVPLGLYPDDVYRLPARLGVNKDFVLNDIQTPWPSTAPVVASWKGRGFEYPADLAAILRSNLGTQGDFELKRLEFGLRAGFDRDWSTDPAVVAEYNEIDRLFRRLEDESKGPGSEITRKLGKAIVPLLGIDPLKVRNPMDAFRIALDHCSRSRINFPRSPEFAPRTLGAAVQKAFGGGRLSFSGLGGRAAFCGLLFAAAAVDAGSKIGVTFATAGVERVARIAIS